MNSTDTIVKHAVRLLVITPVNVEHILSLYSTVLVASEVVREQNILSVRAR